MPELPEVETIVRDMNEAIAGARITDIDCLTRSVWRGRIPSRNSLVGREINKFQRRGKHILMHLSDNHTLVFHLKMTGRLTLHDPGCEPAAHTHMIMKLDNRELCYADVRRFGFIHYMKTSRVNKAEYVARLGPDALSISTDEFIGAVKSRNRPIKAALLDQTVISGLGNIYSDEALFDAGIRPSRKASNVSKNRLRLLEKNIKMVLRKAIMARGSSVSDFVDGSGRKGSYQSHHKVYGRTGDPCFNCGMDIRRVVIAGRSSHFCPRCQR
jgi:formamidopyrimidine-DNA glycosylase